MTGSEIFDTFFGIHSLYPNDLGQALQRYGYLASNPYRSPAEERELHGLRERLKQGGVEPSFSPVPRYTRAGVIEKTPSRKTRQKKSAAKKRVARKKTSRTKG